MSDTSGQDELKWRYELTIEDVKLGTEEELIPLRISLVVLSTIISKSSFDNFDIKDIEAFFQDYLKRKKIRNVSVCK